MVAPLQPEEMMELEEILLGISLGLHISHFASSVHVVVRIPSVSGFCTILLFKEFCEIHKSACIVLMMQSSENA